MGLPTGSASTPSARQRLQHLVVCARRFCCVSILERFFRAFPPICFRGCYTPNGFFGRFRRSVFRRFHPLFPRLRAPLLELFPRLRAHLLELFPRPSPRTLRASYNLPVMSAEVGETLLGKSPMSWPSSSTRNLWKFHRTVASDRPLSDFWVSHW